MRQALCVLVVALLVASVHGVSISDRVRHASQERAQKIVAKVDEQYFAERGKHFAPEGALLETEGSFHRQGVSHHICVSWGDTHMEPFGGTSFYNIYDNRGKWFLRRCCLARRSLVLALTSPRSSPL